MCEVVQRLDARNWRWGRMRFMRRYSHGTARHLPPNKLQKWIRVTGGNEQIKNVHCCDNHADESCTISTIKNIIKSMNCRTRSTLTWNPSSPTLQKDCGGAGKWSRSTVTPSRAALNICSTTSILFWTISAWHASRSSTFNCCRSCKYAHGTAMLHLHVISVLSLTDCNGVRLSDWYCILNHVNLRSWLTRSRTSKWITISHWYRFGRETRRESFLQWLVEARSCPFPLKEGKTAICRGAAVQSSQKGASAPDWKHSNKLLTPVLLTVINAVKITLGAEC